MNENHENCLDVHVIDLFYFLCQFFVIVLMLV